MLLQKKKKEIGRKIFLTSYQDTRDMRPVNPHAARSKIWNDKGSGLGIRGLPIFLLEDTVGKMGASAIEVELVPAACMCSLGSPFRTPYEVKCL